MSRVPTPAQVRDEMVAKLTRYKEGFLAFECFEEAADMLEMANRLTDVKIAKKSKTTVAWGEPPALTKEDYLARLGKIEPLVSLDQPFDALVTTVACPKGTKIILGDDVYEQCDDVPSTSWKRSSKHDGLLSWCCFSSRAVYELYTRGVKFVFPPEKNEETKESAV